MSIKFTIGRKISTGFGLLIVFILCVFMLTKYTLKNSRTVNDEIIHVHSPSVDALQELKILVLNSKMLVTNWVVVQSAPEKPEKQILNKITNVDYPFSKKRIDEISVNWTEKENNLKEEIFTKIEYLFSLHETVKSQLVSFESYDDPEVKFLCEMMIEDGGDIDLETENVLLLLDDMIALQRQNTELGSAKMIRSFDLLEAVVIWLGLALVIGGIIIAYVTVQTIVRPILKLKNQILLLGKGVIPEEKMEPSSDEIGEMAEALNGLIDGFKRTTQFAQEVGSGNFESDYQPLSQEDVLGHALLRMRTDLHANEQILERKVMERTEEVVRQKEEIENQKKEMEHLYTEVTDSIKYAKRLQNAILPPDSYVNKVLPNSFILFKPKDIVSGDFYWIDQKAGKTHFAAIDCTGHGVPGAFMTIIGYNGLSHAISELENPKPSDVLNGLNKKLSETFHQDERETNVKDGMDAAMCSINFDTLELEFAGAFNPMFLVRNGEVEQVKADKFPVGAYIGNERSLFTNNKIQLRKEDTIYIFSDGYCDQFGGPKGKKFMFKNFRDLLLSVQDKPMSQQKLLLDKAIEEWRGDLEQVDDILIIGLKV